MTLQLMDFITYNIINTLKQKNKVGRLAMPSRNMIFYLDWLKTRRSLCVDQDSSGMDGMKIWLHR